MADSSPPERFALPMRVAPADIDEQGHVNNIVYVRWVQDVAVAHWRTLTTPAQRAAVVWVVARHEIDYRRPARPDEDLRLETWVGMASKRTFERHTEILRAADGTLLAKARTLWVPLDPATLRVVEVDTELRALFSIGEA